MDAPRPEGRQHVAAGQHRRPQHLGVGQLLEEGAGEGLGGLRQQLGLGDQLGDLPDGEQRELLRVRVLLRDGEPDEGREEGGQGGGRQGAGRGQLGAHHLEGAEPDAGCGGGEQQAGQLEEPVPRQQRQRMLQGPLRLRHKVSLQPGRHRDGQAGVLLDCQDRRLDQEVDHHHGVLVPLALHLLGERGPDVGAEGLVLQHGGGQLQGPQPDHVPLVRLLLVALPVHRHPEHLAQLLRVVPGVDAEPEQRLDRLARLELAEKLGDAALAAASVLPGEQEGGDPEVVLLAQAPDQPHQELGPPVGGDVLAGVHEGGEDAKATASQAAAAARRRAGSAHRRHQHL